MTWRRLRLATSGLVVLGAMTAYVDWFLHRQPIGLDAHYYRGTQASSVYPVTLTNPILTALYASPDTARSSGTPPCQRRNSPPSGMDFC